MKRLFLASEAKHPKSMERQEEFVHTMKRWVSVSGSNPPSYAFA